MATSAALVAFWWRDPIFGAAVLAAPIFWAIAWLYIRPSFDPSWPLYPPAYYLLPVAGYPVLEEIIFRGGLQGWLLRYGNLTATWSGITAANAITSLVFSAFHLLSHTPGWAIAVFIPSLIFGYFLDRHRTLAPPIVLHVFYNAGYFWLFRP